MIRTLRAFYLSRILREKLLLVGFLGIAVIMWGSSYSSRLGQLLRTQHATAAQLKDQAFWLKNSAQIKADTEKAAAQMDPNKTLDLTNLAVTVRQIADNANLRINNQGGSPAMSSGQFTINTQRFNVPAADWKNFATFYQHLQERSPYVAITELAMQPVRGNPSQVTASLTVASFEIKH